MLLCIGAYARIDIVKTCVRFNIIGIFHSWPDALRLLGICEINLHFHVCSPGTAPSRRFCYSDYDDNFHEWFNRTLLRQISSTMFLHIVGEINFIYWAHRRHRHCVYQSVTKQITSAPRVIADLKSIRELQSYLKAIQLNTVIWSHFRRHEASSDVLFSLSTGIRRRFNDSNHASNHITFTAHWTSNIIPCHLWYRHLFGITGLVISCERLAIEPDCQ